MRIDANRPTQQVQGVQGTSALRGLEGANAIQGDSLTISSKAADIRLAMEAIKNAPDTREAEVESLRVQVEQGTFEADLEALAAKLVP
jgi:flagellar biosynthesis anti-sigma factor FlgM